MNCKSYHITIWDETANMAIFQMSRKYADHPTSTKQNDTPPGISKITPCKMMAGSGPSGFLSALFILSTFCKGEVHSTSRGVKLCHDQVGAQSHEMGWHVASRCTLWCWHMWNHRWQLWWQLCMRHHWGLPELIQELAGPVFSNC